MFTPLRAIATIAALALAMPAFADGLMVHDAYARSASPAAKLVEMHTHIESDAGVMQMVHVEEGFAVPAGEMLVVERKPGKGNGHDRSMGHNHEKAE